MLTCHLQLKKNKQNIMYFLDVQIIREDKKFTTYEYQKHSFSGAYTYFDILLPSTYNFGTIYILSYRCFGKCSSWTILHIDLLFLKQFFLTNDYPESFMNL